MLRTKLPACAGSLSVLMQGTYVGVVIGCMRSSSSPTALSKSKPLYWRTAERGVKFIIYYFSGSMIILQIFVPSSII